MRNAVFFGAMVVAFSSFAAPQGYGSDDGNERYRERMRQEQQERINIDLQRLRDQQTNGFAIDPRNGNVYPGVQGGAINPSNGDYYPQVGGGYIDPSNGQYFPSGR